MDAPSPGALSIAQGDQASQRLWPPVLGIPRSPARRLCAVAAVPQVVVEPLQADADSIEESSRRTRKPAEQRHCRQDYGFPRLHGSGARLFPFGFRLIGTGDGCLHTLAPQAMTSACQSLDLHNFVHLFAQKLPRSR